MLDTRLLILDSSRSHCSTEKITSFLVRKRSSVSVIEKLRGVNNNNNNNNKSEINIPPLTRTRSSATAERQCVSYARLSLRRWDFCRIRYIIQSCVLFMVFLSLWSESKKTLSSGVRLGEIRGYFNGERVLQLQDGIAMHLMLLMIVQLKRNLYHHHHQLVTLTKVREESAMVNFLKLI